MSQSTTPHGTPSMHVAPQAALTISLIQSFPHGEALLWIVEISGEHGTSGEDHWDSALHACTISGTPQHVRFTTPRGTILSPSSTSSATDESRPHSATSQRPTDISEHTYQPNDRYVPTDSTAVTIHLSPVHTQQLSDLDQSLPTAIVRLVDWWAESSADDPEEEMLNTSDHPEPKAPHADDVAQHSTLVDPTPPMSDDHE